MTGAPGGRRTLLSAPMLRLLTGRDVETVSLVTSFRKLCRPGRERRAGQRGSEARPRLPHGVRLVHNEAQGGLVLLAPERVFKPDAIAVAILQRCTGEKTFRQIVDELVAAYNAPADRVLADVTALLRSLADKKLLEL